MVLPSKDTPGRACSPLREQTNITRNIYLVKTNFPSVVDTFIPFVTRVVRRSFAEFSSKTVLIASAPRCCSRPYCRSSCPPPMRKWIFSDRTGRVLIIMVLTLSSRPHTTPCPNKQNYAVDYIAKRMPLAPPDHIAKPRTCRRKISNILCTCRLCT